MIDSLQSQHAPSLSAAHLYQATAVLNATLGRCAPWRRGISDRVLIQTLGGLFIVRDQQQIEIRGKGRTLLVELLAHGGYDVCAARVAHALWPHGEHDYAMGALNTTLYRLRKQPGMADVVSLHDGRLSIVPQCCVVDRWVLESAVDAATVVLELGHIERDEAALLQLLSVIVSTYRGPLFSMDDGATVEAARAQLRAQVLMLVQRAEVLLNGVNDEPLGWCARVNATHPIHLAA
jgi:DNA-binding SARP family transcriptional activator